MKPWPDPMPEFEEELRQRRGLPGPPWALIELGAGLLIIAVIAGLIGRYG